MQPFLILAAFSTSSKVEEGARSESCPNLARGGIGKPVCRDVAEEIPKPMNPYRSIPDCGTHED